MISIITPTYNRISSLQTCIESILCQVYEGIELIIIEDCSTDSTKEYLLTLKDNYPFIKVILNDQNYGVNYSRNRGIEIASKDYILFLDSDDALMENSLIHIREVLENNKKTSHFLFNVSDREEEFKERSKVIPIQYADWISGNTQGDFTHVIRTDIMKKYLFFEEFRMFEHLNWLRIKKETSPQLFIPTIIAKRERGRNDSLTSSMKLKDVSVIETKFASQKLFFSLYYNDLIIYHPKSLSFHLLETIILGVACKRKKDSKALIALANKYYIKLLGKIVLLLPALLLEYLIIRYSSFKDNKVKVH